MTGVELPAGWAVSHRAGYANYRGDQRHMVGEVKGPTTYGKEVVAIAADYDETADRTRVEFCFVVERAS